MVDQPNIDEPFVQAVAQAAIANAGFDPGLATITAPGAGGDPNTTLTVNISYPYTFQFMTLFMELFGGNTITLETQIVMRNE